MPYDIRLDRVYTPVTDADGARVLVDRLWPRGKRKAELQLTEWCGAASPPSFLRKSWHSGKIDDATFTQRYHEMLAANVDSLIPLMRYARAGRLTLLTASRNPEHSHLPILKRALLDALKKEDDEADGHEPSSPTCYL